MAPTAVTATGLPIAVPPSKKVTVPVAPITLMLCDETVAVSVAAVWVFALDGAVTVVIVAALVTVRFRVAFEPL